MTDEQIKEMTAEAALPFTRKIGTIQLIGLIGIAVSPFVLIWGPWQLSLKIALTGILLTCLMWFAHKVTINVMTSVVKAKVKEEESKPQVRKSRWQRKLEEIQRSQVRGTENGVSDMLDDMLRESKKYE